MDKERQIREIIGRHIGGTYENKQRCAEEILHLFVKVNENVEIRYCVCSTECLGCCHKGVECKQLKGHRG